MSNSGYFLIQTGRQSFPWFVITVAFFSCSVLLSAFSLEMQQANKEKSIPLCTCSASRRHADALCKELSRLALHYRGRLFNEDTQGTERQLDYDQAMFSI